MIIAEIPRDHVMRREDHLAVEDQDFRQQDQQGENPIFHDATIARRAHQARPARCCSVVRLFSYSVLTRRPVSDLAHAWCYNHPKSIETTSQRTEEPNNRTTD